MSRWLWFSIQTGWFVLASLVMWRCGRLLRDAGAMEHRLQSIQRTLEAHVQRLNGHDHRGGHV
jgi:hypothetical protein